MLVNDKDFKQWVSDLKNDIRRSQIRAMVKVNSDMLRLYWRMGADICEKQKTTSWGDGWLNELSRELMAEFPEMKGFSYRNLRYIRQWYEFYNQDVIIWQQPVAKLGDTNMQQPVAQIGEDVFFSVPWGHHLYIISQCKDVDKAIFYLNQTVEQGWSRAVLLNFIDTDLYGRQGKAVTNFDRFLPDEQSDLAKQTLKDPYSFDFLTLDGVYRERELENGLMQNVTRFLLELGTGFALVGRQVPLVVGDETVYPDLLFYHLELKCYVVIELKVDKFKGEHLGQLGLYVSAVNHLKKKPTDNPTIGLLICKTKNNVMAQYALESTNQPIGISEYQLSQLMSEDIKSQLPTIEDIESTLSSEE
jgi:predicted nuclease of restriction endonuclease-like (RecB) superfamily